MLNKKGLFLPVLAILTISLLLFALFMTVTNKNKPRTEYIGEIQGKVIETYQNAEKNLLYSDLVAKKAINNTIIFFEKGVSKDFEKNFSLATKEFIKQYGINITYNLLFEDNSIIGIAQNKSVLNKTAFNNNELKYSIGYEFNSSFKEYISPNFDNYITSLKDIDNLLECLQTKDSSIDNNIKSCKFDREYKLEGNLLILEIPDKDWPMKVSVDLLGKEIAKEFGKSV